MKNSVKIIFSLIIISFFVGELTENNNIIVDSYTENYEIDEYSNIIIDNQKEYYKKIIEKKLGNVYEIRKIDISFNDNSYIINKVDIYLFKSNNFTEVEKEEIIVDLANKLLVKKEIITIHVE